MSNKKFDTICAQENIDIESGHSHVLPIHATSSFSYKTIEDSINVFTNKKEGFVYSRYDNPTVQSVALKLAQLESIDLEVDAKCYLTSSGMSAISTLCLSMLNSGDVLLTQNNLYGGTMELFKKVLAQKGIDIIFIDLSDEIAVNKTLSENDNIKMIYLESPSNPTLKCIDIQKLGQKAREHNILTAIDNTFCTSYIQRPLTLGIDFVIYSTTKYLNGHGNSLAGAIIFTNNQHDSKIWTTLKLVGTNTNAFDAWLLHNGIKTLPLRMDKHCSNAMTIAQYLNDHPKILKVNYPGLNDHQSFNIAKKQMNQFGAMMSFEIKGGYEEAVQFMNTTKICTIAATLGNVDTLLLHPVSASHLNVEKHIRDSQGITDGLIRMSVGIENVEDIIQDINHAL